MKKHIKKFMKVVLVCAVIVAASMNTQVAKAATVDLPTGWVYMNGVWVFVNPQTGTFMPNTYVDEWLTNEFSAVTPDKFFEMNIYPGTTVYTYGNIKSVPATEPWAALGYTIFYQDGVDSYSELWQHSLSYDTSAMDIQVVQVDPLNAHCAYVVKPYTTGVFDVTVTISHPGAYPYVEQITLDIEDETTIRAEVTASNVVDRGVNYYQAQYYNAAIGQRLHEFEKCFQLEQKWWTYKYATVASDDYIVFPGLVLYDTYSNEAITGSYLDSRCAYQLVAEDGMCTHTGCVSGYGENVGAYSSFQSPIDCVIQIYNSPAHASLANYTIQNAMNCFAVRTNFGMAFGEVESDVSTSIPKFHRFYIESANKMDIDEYLDYLLSLYE